MNDVPLQRTLRKRNFPIMQCSWLYYPPVLRQRGLLACGSSEGDEMQRTALKIVAILSAAWLLICGPGVCASAAEQPPRFTVPAAAPGDALTFVVYGDTRFTENDKVVNAIARRALVEKIALEHPAAILIGGDLVYRGSDARDYQVYQSETRRWEEQRIPVFPVLGNHEFSGCGAELAPCLENWWNTFGSLRPYRWYSVTLGSSLRALILDSDAPLKKGSDQRAWFEEQIGDANTDPNIKFILIMLHYPPVTDPFYPSVRDEKEIHRYLSWRVKSLHAQVIVVGSHVHNYERYYRSGVTYLVSGGGGAKPVPSARIFGEKSRLHTSVNYHYIRFVLDSGELRATMVRFDATERGTDPWTEPDHFEIKARRPPN
jgi:acid phosphatase type 7